MQRWWMDGYMGTLDLGVDFTEGEKRENPEKISTGEIN